MEIKEQYKEAFKVLKEEVNINSLFSEFNRQMVLSISSGSAHPRAGSTLEDVLKESHETMSSIVGEDWISSEHKHGDFVKKDITEDSSFKYYSIKLPQYNIYIDYFVNLDPVDSDKVPPAETYMEYYRKSDSIFSTIIIRQKHDCVTDETIGKILKHEITHIILYAITYLSTMGVDYIASIEDENDRKTFDEFLCDYIQCEAITGPSDSPIAVFDDVRKTYLTWVANDAYDPYLNAISEYYKELSEHSEEVDDQEEP